MAEISALSVGELTSRIKIVLEGGLPVLWVRGEVSQFTQHRSGHCYFTLSDEQSQLACVLWRGRVAQQIALPQVGDSVLAYGKVVVYERGGRYQFDCYELRPAGVGDLSLAFEALKQKLAAEGLFALERKISLPPFPERIGLVTSPDGAALQDILRVARERAPWTEFLLAPAAVQGSGAAGEIAAGIKALDEKGWAQVIIVGRGGGAPEDLWAFNEAAVVRAVANCQTPIVSAVGHEVDVTLCDLAADLRAPTPSAAAEMVLPDKEALRQRFEELGLRLKRSLEVRISKPRRWLEDHVAVLLRSTVAGLWREESQRTDELARRLDAARSRLMERRRTDLNLLQEKLSSLSPQAVLARGYSIVRKQAEARPILSAKDLLVEDAIRITFHQGEAGARITQTKAG
ncbi:MAG TPA: exodeoxyribonuclease VII large subunit [bacterium]